MKLKELAASNPDQLRTPPAFTTMEKSANKVKIVIDLGFDKVMNEKELQKTFKQVKRCYSYNRRSKGNRGWQLLIELSMNSIGTYLPIRISTF